MADLHTGEISVTEERSAGRYLLIALVPMLLLAVAMFATGLWLGPAVGDLTRIGGYSERDFGWQDPEELLLAQNTPVKRPALSAILSGKSASDIIIFGDSFSLDREGKITWIDVLQHRTGLSIQVLRYENYKDVVEYLTSDVFRTNPPRAVIVETVERSLLIHARSVYDPDASCARPGPLRLAIGQAENAGPIRSEPVFRRTKFENLDELYSRAAIAFRAWVRGQGKVGVVNLTRSDLFSNLDSASLLFFFDDVSRHRSSAFAPLSPEAATKAMGCGLRHLASLAGNVPFRLVAAPDKRTIYAPWIADPLPEKALDLFAVAQEALGPVLLDVRKLLQDAANSGMHDVYLPNDTHWGSPGHRLVGEAVANSLLTTYSN